MRPTAWVHLVALAMSENVAAATSEPSFRREMLSTHATVAVYRGIEMGRESLRRIYPPQEDRRWAVFDIEAYVAFEKPGRYGDERQRVFKILADESNFTSALHLAALAEGDRVRLDWTHAYVTRTETVDGRETSASYPERAVTALRPVDAAGA